MKLKKAIDIIVKKMENEYFSDLKISSLSEKFFLDRSYLSSEFKKAKGISFSKMLTDIRIQKAKEFLTLSDYSTETISELVGYSDRAYFSRVFLKQTDMTPSAYRLKSRLNTSNYEENYIYISVFKNDPLIASLDIKGLKRFSDEFKVHATIESADIFDNVSMLNIFKNAVLKKPSGIMLCATDEIFLPYINDAIASGVPVITVDCDLSMSKRIATVGSDWYQIGKIGASKICELIDEKGKIMSLFMSNSENTNSAYNGFFDELISHKDIHNIGSFYDYSNIDYSKQIVEKTILSTPELKGIAAFDSNSALGACEILSKYNLLDKIKIVSVDMGPTHLSLLKQGFIHFLIGQKRELFTYYGGKLLYDYNKNYQIPQKIDTGLILIDSQNINHYNF